jgi:6-phosphofructokinase 2
MEHIVSITINPAVDTFVNVSQLEPARKLRCSTPKRDPGGGGINVARVAHRLGGKVTAVYPAGGAIGKLLHRLMEREGIASIVTASHVETRENFTVYEESTGQQYRFVLPGSALHPAEWEACLDTLVSLPHRPQIVVASGSIPPGVPEDFFARVARHAKDLGAKMVLDTSGPGLKAALIEGVTLFTPNLVEFREFVDMTLEKETDYVIAARKLIFSGQTNAVALTLGEHGSLLITADKAWRAEAMPIDVISTVGAGDSFVGGLVAAWAGGETLDGAFRTAVAAASAAVMSPGTELCREGDVERLLSDVWIKNIE